MKKKRFAMLAVMLLTIISCMLMTGCGSWKNYIHTESSLKRTAETAMKDKYEEEFVIHNVRTATQTTFYAICSPKNDEEVVFEAQIYKDGRGVFEDEYVQGIVAKQVSEKLADDLKEISKEYVIKPHVFYEECVFDNLGEVTIESYITQVGHLHCYYVILINEEQINEVDYRREYNILKKCGQLC